VWWAYGVVVGLPSGTVTLLITDIEDSTRRWLEDRSGMEAALARHDRLLYEVVEAHRGSVFKHTGDGICAAFEAAGDAVAAAVVAQSRLELPVRMGLHTGELTPSGGDYHGTVVNEAARVADAGHGGQIVLSAATASLVDGGSLTDLGSHQLKGLNRLTRLWQVGAGSFPPLRVTTALAGNLVADLPRLLGRELAVAGLVVQLDRARLVSLVGVGGVGKTSLAQVVSGEVRDRYPDGVWFVELAAVGDRDTLLASVAGVFRHVVGAGVSAEESLVRLLERKRLLLILDNCEHLLDPAAEFVAFVLERCDGVDVLVTSREGLGLPGEYQMSVASLPCSDLDQPGVQLFIERARQVRPDFVVDAETGADVVEVCRRLDGIPLAIELAATRTRSLTPGEIRSRLDDRFRLLATGRRRVVERHQTLLQTVQWSYDLLSDEERTLFRRLGVFAGGVTLRSVEAVCAADPLDPADIIDLVDGLVAKSLLVAETISGVTRYRMLETIRQFAEERLNESPEATTIRDTFIGYYVARSREYLHDLHEDVDGAGMRWLDLEFDNLRATHEHGVETLSTEIFDAVSAGIPLVAWWRLRYEALGWATQAIETLEHADIEPLPILLAAAVYEPMFAGDLDRASHFATRALVPAPDGATPIQNYSAAMSTAFVRGEAATVIELYDKLLSAPPEPACFAHAAPWVTASAYLLLDDVEQARLTLDHAAQMFDSQMARTNIMWGYGRLEEDPDRSILLLQRARDLAEQVGHRFITVAIERDIGAALVRADDPRGSVEVLTPLLERWYAAGDSFNWASVVCMLTLPLAELRHDELAAVLIGWVEQRQGFGLSVTTITAADLTAVADRVCAELGETSFDELTRNGATLSDEALMTRIRPTLANVLGRAPTANP